MAAGFNERRFSWLPLAVVVAVCLFGSASSVQAGCGDYLVGVSQTAEQASHAPMNHDDRAPVCRSCGEHGTPVAPVLEIERLVIDPLLLTASEPPILERARWSPVDSLSKLRTLSPTPDRPPKFDD